MPGQTNKSSSTVEEFTYCEGGCFTVNGGHAIHPTEIMASYGMISTVIMQYAS